MEKQKIHIFFDFLKKSSFSPYNEKRRPLSEFEAWIDCLYVADEKGICNYSLNEWSERWCWNSRSKVRRFLNKLEKQKYIVNDTETTTSFYIKAFSQWREGSLPAERCVEETKQIIEYLNKILGNKQERNKIRYTDDRRKAVASRLRENNDVTVDDCFQMIMHKHSEWGSTDQRKYIRMETLFTKKHFRNYIEEARQWKTRKSGAGSFFKPRIHG